MGRRGLGNGLEGKEKGGSLCAKKGKRRREVLGKVGGKGRESGDATSRRR